MGDITSDEEEENSDDRAAIAGSDDEDDGDSDFNHAAVRFSGDSDYDEEPYADGPRRQTRRRRRLRKMNSDDDKPGEEEDLTDRHSKPGTPERPLPPKRRRRRSTKKPRGKDEASPSPSKDEASPSQSFSELFPGLNPTQPTTFSGWCANNEDNTILGGGQRGEEEEDLYDNMGMGGMGDVDDEEAKPANCPSGLLDDDYHPDTYIKCRADLLKHLSETPDANMTSIDQQIVAITGYVGSNTVHSTCDVTSAADAFRRSRMLFPGMPRPEDLHVYEQWASNIVYAMENSVAIDKRVKSIIAVNAIMKTVHSLFEMASTFDAHVRGSRAAANMTMLQELKPLVTATPSLAPNDTHGTSYACSADHSDRAMVALHDVMRKLKRYLIFFDYTCCNFVKADKTLVMREVLELPERSNRTSDEHIVDTLMSIIGNTENIGKKRIDYKEIVDQIRRKPEFLIKPSSEFVYLRAPDGDRHWLDLRSGARIGAPPTCKGYPFMAIHGNNSVLEPSVDISCPSLDSAWCWLYDSPMCKKLKTLVPNYYRIVECQFPQPLYTDKDRCCILLFIIDCVFRGGQIDFRQTQKFFAIIGVPGCAKSTIMTALMALVTPDHLRKNIEAKGDATFQFANLFGRSMVVWPEIGKEVADFSLPLFLSLTGHDKALVITTKFKDMATYINTLYQVIGFGNGPPCFVGQDGSRTTALERRSTFIWWPNTVDFPQGRGPLVGTATMNSVDTTIPQKLDAEGETVAVVMSVIDSMVPGTYGMQKITPNCIPGDTRAIYGDQGGGIGGFFANHAKIGVHYKDPADFSKGCYERGDPKYRPNHRMIMPLETLCTAYKKYSNLSRLTAATVDMVYKAAIGHGGYPIYCGKEDSFAPDIQAKAGREASSIIPIALHGYSIQTEGKPYFGRTNADDDYQIPTGVFLCNIAIADASNFSCVNGPSFNEGKEGDDDNGGFAAFAPGQQPSASKADKKADTLASNADRITEVESLALRDFYDNWQNFEPDPRKLNLMWLRANNNPEGLNAHNENAAYARITDSLEWAKTAREQGSSAAPQYKAPPTGFYEIMEEPLQGDYSVERIARYIFGTTSNHAEIDMIKYMPLALRHMLIAADAMSSGRRSPETSKYIPLMQNSLDALRMARAVSMRLQNHVHKFNTDKACRRRVAADWITRTQREKTHAMINPELAKTYCKPAYLELINLVVASVDEKYHAAVKAHPVLGNPRQKMS